jgi:hypothetical protein
MLSDPILTVGHSNRSLSDFLDILRSAEIQTLIDIRRFPASRRHPHFNAGPLRSELASVGLHYQHFPELGGYREQPEARDVSLNDGWPPGLLRNYVNYAMTSAFRTALHRLRCGTTK